MTEIWVKNKRDRIARCVGAVSQDRARHVASEWNRRGFRVQLRQVSEDMFLIQ